MLTPASTPTRRLDLTSMQLFVAVCEEGSIARAAQREHLAASAVSKRLSDLESSVDTALLYRHARGVDLTPAGETFLHHARTVLFNMDRLQVDLDEYAAGIKGHVRVHANISAIVQFLPEDLASFSRAHGQIKIDLQEHVSTDIARAVAEGQADLGIAHVAQPLRDLVTQPYRKDRLVVVVPAQHPLAENDAVDFAQTLDYDHVGLHSNSALYLAMRRAATQANKPLRLRIQVTGLDAMCRMVQAGLGIGLLPDRAFALLGSGMGALRAVALTDPWAERTLQLVARNFGTLPLTARMLVEHLQQSSRSHFDS
ncbi:LysR family transcriptional regulator [Curvibacter sp. APW13]|uniref:LysR family transcriptional regulator n=1 Tax=Curvibacter sp. APW13 TaxID=3077236 RepID=UPI0028DD4B67|nr:LysR family transcriptional regulator [Curvibacter sp. APW13]MDT8989405.1 LysR family transcriptional regulator [Curvibacter sp. APW13]